MPGGDVQRLMVPMILILATALLTWACRWTFRLPPPGRRPVVAERPADFGLLVPVATTRTAQDAAQLQALLRRHGIRSTSAPAPVTVTLDGGYGTDGSHGGASVRDVAPAESGRQVLVFGRDMEQARRVVAGSG